MEELIKDKNYFAVQGWFVNELGLKGNELLVYSIIYGFSQDGESKFKGSRKYLAEWLGVSLPTVDKTLANLIKKELIIKEQKVISGVTFNSYYANLGVVKNFYRGCKDFLYNNIEYKEEDNISNDILSKKNKKFIPPTKEEVRAYCMEKGYNIDVDKFYDYYDVADWKDSQGNKVKNWKQRVITWNSRNSNNTQQPPKPQRKIAEYAN